MIKIKKWKLILAATLAALVAATFGLALHFSTRSAAASEDGVLDGNTATYEIINDERETLLWTYKRSTNEWTSANSKSDSNYTKPTPDQANKLTLKVTEAGGVAFQWKLSGHWAYLAIAVKHYKAADIADGDLSSAQFTYVVNRGYQEIAFDKNTSYGGDFTNTEKATSYDGHDVTIPCDAGDYITIEALWDSNSRTYGVAVKGLKLPTKTFTVNAKIADGQESLGTLKADRDNETGTDTLEVKRGYDESVIFTAVPNGNAVAAYWTDSENKKICPTADLTVSGISEKNDATTYIAHFVTEEDMKPVSASNADGTKYWETDASGKTTLDLSLEYKSGENPNYTFGIVIPEGGGYLEIDYTYWTADDLNSNQLFIDEVNMWGSSPSSSSPSATAASWLGYKDRTPHFALARTPRDKSVERPTEKYLQWVGGAGYYTGKINIQIGSYEYTAGDEFSINSVKVVNELTDFEDLTLDFDPELTTMTMKYQGHDDPISITANVPVQVPVGLTNVTFTASQTDKTKASKYDESKTVNYYTKGFSGEKIIKTITNRLGTTQKPYEDLGTYLSTSDSFYLTFFSKKGVGFSSGSTSDPLTTNDHVPYDVEEAKIKVLYAEEVPISLTATAMTDGDNTEKEIEEGGFIGFPYGHANSITLRIRKFENVTQDDLNISVNGEEKNKDVQEVGDAFLFPLQISGATKTQKIEISYLKEDDNENLYSKLKLTFSVGETVDGTIDQIIDHTAEETKGSVEIQNDVENAWTFDPVLSSDENYAFSLIKDKEAKRSGDSVAYYGQVAVSNLTFTMTGAPSGGLSFEFRLEGYFQEGGVLWKALRVGQLWYRNTTPFTQSDNTTVGAIKGEEWTETLDGAICLGRPNAAKDGGMEFANSAVALDDGWHQVSIPIQQNTPLYLGFLVCGQESSGRVGLPDDGKCSAAIRNVQLATGEKTATLKICSDAGDSSSATATVGADSHQATTDGAPVTVTAGSLVKLSATLGGTDTFYGWSVNGVLVSTETDANVFVNDDSVITAWIAPAETYKARADGTFYRTVKKAAEGAKLGQTIYLLEDRQELTESFTIKKGVTFLLPYSDEGKLTATGSAGEIAWIANSAENRYLTVTVKQGVTITVNGTLQVGGVVNATAHNYQGHTSGKYAEMILEKGSKIQVANGGVMDVYGRVWGGEGKSGEEMGTIDVAEGGKLYEPFLILDFSGGTNAAAAFLSDNPTTPFKRYAMINIEVPMTIHYGGELLGHASLYALNQFFSLDQPFVSKQTEGASDTFVMLHEGASVRITYDPTKVLQNATAANGTKGIGKINMVFEGGATFSYMLFSAMGISVPTNSVYFSIPYNYEVELNDFAAAQNGRHAEYETKTDFMIMPGAKVTVGSGATLTLNANAWVLDGLVQGVVSGKSYPAADDLAASGYSRSGNFIVNGTLVIGKKTTVQKFEIFGSDDPFVSKTIGATFLGIVQTGGTGRIEIPNGDGELKTKLEGTIFDGITGGGYGTNYFAYTTTARVWVANLSGGKGGFANLVAGKTYTATGSTSFTLENVKYKTTESGEESNELKLGSAMTGAWKEVHANHQYDWTPKEGEASFSHGNTETITRTCTVLGCTETATRTLLKDIGKFGDKTYKGAAYDPEELFDELYGDAGNLHVSFAVEGGLDLKNAAEYSITVTIPEEYGFFVVGGQLKSEATFTFTITPKAIEVTISDQEATYTGAEPTVSQSGYTTEDGAVFAGDQLGITITKALGVDANKYNLTAAENKGTQYANKNYTITFKYTNGEHSVFTIHKATLTVKATGSTPQGEELKYTFTVSGYQNGEENLLGENAEKWWEGKITITMPEGFSKNSAPKDYNITLAWKDGQEITLQNYEIVFATDGKYTITDPLFTGVQFACGEQTCAPNGTIEITYDGQEHTVTATNIDGMQVSYAGDGNTQTDAGTYTIKATVTKGDYHQELSVTLVIKQRDVHVTLLQQEKEYDGAVASVSSAQNVGWKFATDGFKLCGNDEISVLGIALSLSAEDAQNVNAGTYDIITQKNESGNYKVIFDNAGTGLYKINPKRIDVTVTSKVTKYGEEIALDPNGYTFDESLLVGDDNISITLSTDAVDAYRAQPYDITGTAPKGSAQNDNYDIHITNGTWTVNRRSITVVIEAQSATYDPAHNYAFVGSKWHVKEGEGDGLARSDTKDVLAVTLTKPNMTDANTYDITGAWDNENYAVTFEGGTDAYTINKKDITATADFFIMADDMTPTGDLLSVTFGGQPITITGYVTLGEDMLGVTLSKSTITEIGEYEVTVTVNETNYSGSKTFRLVVTNADGYTKNLVDTLDRLEELAGGLTAETLTANDFDTLKQVKALIDALSEEEKTTGEAALTPYEALLSAWNDAVEGLDEKIETAQSIGDALLNGLFSVTATLSALAVAAYVFGKGGML